MRPSRRRARPTTPLQVTPRGEMSGAALLRPSGDHELRVTFADTYTEYRFSRQQIIDLMALATRFEQRCGEADAGPDRLRDTFEKLNG